MNRIRSTRKMWRIERHFVFLYAIVFHIIPDIFLTASGLAQGHQSN